MHDSLEMTVSSTHSLYLYCSCYTQTLEIQLLRGSMLHHHTHHRPILLIEHWTHTHIARTLSPLSITHIEPQPYFFLSSSQYQFIYSYLSTSSIYIPPVLSDLTTNIHHLCILPYSLHSLCFSPYSIYTRRMKLNNASHTL